MLISLIVLGCASSDRRQADEASALEDFSSMTELGALFARNLPKELSNSWKIWGHRNALFTQGFGADPTVMVYEDRVYLFASNDALLYNADGTVKQIEYGTGIQGLRALSSVDLANWTDHGVIQVGNTASTNPLIPNKPPLASFRTVSWAPSAAWKIIDGKPQFFVYYANSGNGIGVITADSPTGPWRSPLNRLLIDRSTPNCGNVEWLFDPGVFVDDDGQAYLFFGGGQNSVDPDNTKNARRVKLGADMISLDGVPETWYVPYLFEAPDITKINGKYYFSYMVNWRTSGNRFGLTNAEIAYMTSDDHPMGKFSSPRGLMTFAASQLRSSDQNNHHCIFEFKGNVYIAYHASKVAEAMGLSGLRYRSPFIDKVNVNRDGSFARVNMTRKGVDQAGHLNPFVLNEAETIGIQGGIYTRPDSDASNGIVVTSIDTGDWVGVYGVDFGSDGAKRFTARIRTPETPGYVGAMELRLDPQGDGVVADNGNLTGTAVTRIKGGEVIGHVLIKAAEGEEGNYAALTVDLYKTVSGVHDLVFVFYSSLGVNPETANPDTRHMRGFEFDHWQFGD